MNFVINFKLYAVTTVRGNVKQVIDISIDNIPILYKEIIYIKMIIVSQTKLTEVVTSLAPR